MALSMVLVILSLLPLLEAQNPEHANITGIPITNVTLTWLSGKWFYVGFASHNLEFKKEAQKIQSEYFYFTPNLTDDTILLPEHQTTEGRCVYNSSQLGVQRENGPSPKKSGNPWAGQPVTSPMPSCHPGQRIGAVEIIPHLTVLKKHGAFMLAFYSEDEKNKGLSLYADKPDIAPELKEVFQKTVKSLGMDESEIIYADWEKDVCSQEQEHLDMKKKKKEKDL
ncbi:alpha-1-acid glycoprotein-like [Psammomys obesus]|uniref:alpha-1-acid glycoprotein-like n=1 Tax=Psammomys obesus TaxID=48139 RepID=UPI002452EA47|nr:alpha-1-acid glycoprotein-like [Psammomys obesus]